MVQQALSVMTEATTKLSAGQLKWTETMWLGREEDRVRSNGNKPNEEENEKQPIPGIETLEGLPPQYIDVLEREAMEDLMAQQRASGTQQTGSFDPFDVREQTDHLPESWNGLPPEWNLS